MEVEFSPRSKFFSPTFKRNSEAAKWGKSSSSEDVGLEQQTIISFMSLWHKFLFIRVETAALRDPSALTASKKTEHDSYSVHMPGFLLAFTQEEPIATASRKQLNEVTRRLAA